MNDQKDTQKTSLNQYGHTDMSGNQTLPNKPLYDFANKKTEKLVTALYMITDCMDSGDAIKGKLRALGVELLSDMYKMSILSPVEKHASVTEALTRISEINAFVEIAHTIGFVSEMNAGILKNEFRLLTTELHSYQAENQNASFGGVLFENQKNSSFTLSSKMFEVGDNTREIANVQRTHFPSNTLIKDMSAHAGKRTDYVMSFKNRNVTPLPRPKGLDKTPQITMGKSERNTKILGLIKDKKNLGAGETGVSIKDISIAFTDCSEKTIQRELNDMVAKGQIRKTGAKRWSRYSYIG